MDKPVSPSPAAAGPRLPKKHSAWYFRGYGFQPDVVFDVGVYGGTGWLYKSFPAARFVLVDPQPGCEDRVSPRPGTYDFHAIALGAEAGSLTLKIPETKPGRGGAMASILDRTDRASNRFSSLSEIEVPVERLDTLAAGYDGRVGIKIDTEGFEGPVLAGAPETLKRAEFVVVEMSVSQRFEGEAHPSTLIARLAEAGLEFRDVLTAATYPGKRKMPHSMDVLFARWDSR